MKPRFPFSFPKLPRWVRIKSLLPQRSRVVDPLAFFLALVGAPIVVALAGLWLLFIPVLAIFYGGPLYLLIGGPILFVLVATKGPHVLTAMALSLMTIFCGAVLAVLAGALQNPVHADIFALYGSFGSLMAPLWAGTFCVLYRKLERRSWTQFNLSHA